jgi:dihydroorotate dehydrogenase
LVLKIAPDLEESQIIDIGELIRNSNIDGVIVSNTTISRPASLRDRKSARRYIISFWLLIDVIANKSEMGGLSGAPLKPRTLQTLKTLRAHVPASIPLIGCGGIRTGADALEFGRAGASLIQVYTGFGYDGAGTCRRIKDELESLLRAENTTWKAVVDDSVKKLSWTESWYFQGKPAATKGL